MLILKIESSAKSWPGSGLKFLKHREPSRLTPDLNQLWTPTTICKRIAILSIWPHHYALFLSIPFLNSLHVSCCSSLVTLFLSSSLLFYTFVSKEIVFGQKYPFLGPQPIGFFTLHTFGKLRIFWCKLHLNWMITSLDINMHKHTLQKH